MAKEGRKDWRFRDKCNLAAALRRQCLAQSMQLATSAIVEESITVNGLLEAAG